MTNTDKIRIVVGINSLTEAQWPAYNSHLQVFYRLGKDFPNAEMYLYNPSRVSIDSMRAGAAGFCVKGKFDYLLFIDDDVVPPPAFLQKLIDCNADIVAGDVIIRGYPFEHMCFRYMDSTQTQLQAMADYPDNEGTVISVDAVGFSLCLIKRELLEKIPEPYFITGVNHTEDIYFCLKARDFVPTCTIKVETSVVCGHILWPEVISSVNKKNYKKYIEEQYPDLLLKDDHTTKLKIVKVDPSVDYAQVMAGQKYD